MANLQETSTWEAGIYQLETSDPVMGGENGIDNRAPRQLANRTLWLKNELAKQIGRVNQADANLVNQKADKATQLTAGAGLTGGGDLSTSRSLSLGTPSTITAATTNTAVSNTHTHAIDKASTTTQGIVQLNSSVSSTSTTQAATP
ncbi:tail fiber protein, partial [Moraxella catarrhalis]